MNNYIYIAVMAAVSYTIRVLPLTLIRKPIKNQFIQSFLYYVPYVTLAVMTFPAIIHATGQIPRSSSFQRPGKVWISKRKIALYNFALENLTQILDAGVDVGMVQVGNEINNGMCGETDASNVRKLLASGSKAVRDAATASGKDILVAVHYTNIDDMKNWIRCLPGCR